MKLVVVRDMKAQLYLRPQFQTSLADALRSWDTVANEGESMITKYPADFRLLHLADFDPNTGRLEVLEPPTDLGSALDFKRPSQPTL